VQAGLDGSTIGYLQSQAVTPAGHYLLSINLKLQLLVLHLAAVAGRTVG
jgi:hypothetical protein